MNKIFSAALFFVFLSSPLAQQGIDKSEIEKICNYHRKMSNGVIMSDECVRTFAPDDEKMQVIAGIYYLSNSEYDNARLWFEKAAKKNNPDAFNGLGFLYQQGYGVFKNKGKANKYFLPSAEQGNSDSQFWLGENYILDGNYKDGFYWTEKAAKNGSLDAQYNLGVLYWNGNGVDKDPTQAYIWMLIAAKQNHEKALLFVQGFEKSLDEKVINNMHKYVERNYFTVK